MKKWSVIEEGKYEDYLDKDSTQENFTTKYEDYNSASFFNPYVPSGYVRPPELIATIDFAFDNLVKHDKEQGYIYTGASDYNIFYYSLSLSYMGLLEEKVKTLDDNQFISVLDVGAGDFQFSEHCQRKFGQKVKVYGIAATDTFISKNKTINEEYQIFNNAEYLSAVFQDIKFDLIFSRATYMHFVDPLGSIAEAYKVLKPGGMLIIDEFYIRGCEDYLDKIISFLREQKILILAQANSIKSSIEGVIIQKPKHNPPVELIFPVLYQKTDSNKVHYMPYLDLLKINNVYINVAYEKKKKAIWKEAETISADLLNKHADNPFPALFADEEYLSLHKKHKVLFILALASKNSQYHEYEKLKKELLQYENSIFMAIFLLKFSIVGNIYEIENNMIFQRYSKILKEKHSDHNVAYKAQLSMIKFTVMSCILKEVKTEEAKHILTEFHLPYNVKKSLSDSKNSLQFSALAAYWQNTLNIKDNLDVESNRFIYASLAP